MSGSKSAKGFTLLELIVGLAITGVLLAMGIPSFLSMIRSNSSVNDANSLLSAITLARSEAIKRNQYVVICAASSATACNTSSSATWNSGILVFVDTNNDGALSTGETVVRSEIPFSTTSTSQLKLTATTYAANLTYKPDGSGGPAGTFTMKPTGQTATTYERCIVIASNSGRPRITDPSDTTATLCN